ncbi:MAG: hypothetical protein ACTSUE_07555 [Promethearchaeota archaeon]
MVNSKWWSFQWIVFIVPFLLYLGGLLVQFGVESFEGYGEITRLYDISVRDLKRCGVSQYNIDHTTLCLGAKRTVDRGFWVSFFRYVLGNIKYCFGYHCLDILQNGFEHAGVNMAALVYAGATACQFLWRCIMFCRNRDDDKTLRIIKNEESKILEEEKYMQKGPPPMIAYPIDYNDSSQAIPVMYDPRFPRHAQYTSTAEEWIDEPTLSSSLPNTTYNTFVPEPLNANKNPFDDSSDDGGEGEVGDYDSDLSLL